MMDQKITFLWRNLSLYCLCYPFLSRVLLIIVDRLRPDFVWFLEVFCCVCYSNRCDIQVIVQ